MQRRDRPVLRRLADRAGILPEYIDQTGTERRVTSDETRVALLRAMQLDAGDEEAATRSLERLEREESERGRRSLDRAAAHRRCPTPAELLGERRLWGIVANLYAVRSARNWGAGDLTDLGDLLAWAGEIGASFVGVNPLHAIRNRGADISPYSPVSRLFRNPLYLDVERVPEYTRSEEARAIAEAEPFRRELERVRAADRVEYEAVMALKRPVLEALHRHSRETPPTSDGGRARAYREYLASQGDALTDFATFLALDEHFGGCDWRRWPASCRDPRSVAVDDFRTEHEVEVDFWRWLQFEIDRQLADAARRGRDAGLPIGLYQDLAIGSAPSGSDTWAFPDLFVTGASLGAPPDQYAAQGQNWGLPPIDPRALAADDFRYWVALIRSALRHAGALRIDHVLGLFRQFWIPAGMSGELGAYVRFPTDELLSVLAAESHRARALIVGEDLGTVPPEVAPALREWGILSSKVMYFERDDENGFLPASRYEPLSLTTADTHDMATIAGFWEGRDIAIRREVGLIATDAEADEVRARRDREREALLARLRAEGVLADAAAPSGTELRGAVHAFLCKTPAALVGLSLDDVVGEVEPINVPGVGVDRYPSWTRRLRLPLESYRTDPGVRATVRCRDRDARTPRAR